MLLVTHFFPILNYTTHYHSYPAYLDKSRVSVINTNGALGYRARKI